MPGFFGSFERVNDGAGVSALEPAVGGDVATAVAVGTRVHHDYRIAVLEEGFGLADDADAIVGNSVKEQHPGAVGIFRAHFPAAQDGAVGSFDDEIVAFAVRVLEAFVGVADKVRG